MSYLHFLLALRSLKRDKTYVIANLIGFSLGISCFLVAAFFLRSELQYDQHFANHEDLYRVATQRTVGSFSQTTAMGAPHVGPTLVRTYPKVISYVRFAKAPILELYNQPLSTTQWDSVFYTDPNVFDFFSHGIVYGDPDSALQNPLSIAISRSMSEFYFGESNPVGMTLSEAEKDYVVTLVFEDLPNNTHMKYDALISWEENQLTMMNSQGRQRLVLMFLAQTHYTYLQMANEYDSRSFREVSQGYVDSGLGEFLTATDMTMNLYLEPLRSIHFQSVAERDLPRGNQTSVLILASLAILVLAIACLNYTSLAVARFKKRVKEVGMRKLLGASPQQIVLPFIAETSVFILVATIASAAFVYLASETSIFQQVVGLSRTTLMQSGIPAILFGIPFFSLMILGTGIIPALTISRMRALDAVSSSSLGQSLSNHRINRSLLAQLTIAIVTIVFTIVMVNQLRFMQEAPLGFEKSNRLSVDVIGADVVRRLPTLISELETFPGILGITVTSDLTNEFPVVSSPTIETEDGSYRSMNINHIVADENFLDVMGISLVQGRNLDPQDRDEIGRTNLVNEALVRQMGWSEPLGKQVGTWTVTGVVEDFNFKSLHHPVEPLVIRTDQENLERVNVLNGSRMRRTLLIHVSEGNFSQSLKYINTKWAEFEPTQPFDYDLLENKLNSLYQSDRNRAYLIGIVALFCISLSGLGTLGLSSFIAEQRTRDIGIRKVLGVSTLQVSLFYFGKLLATILLSSVVGSIIAFGLITQWLQGFYYRTDIELAAFVLATLLVAALVLITSCSQTARIAGQSPSISLRCE